MQRNKHPPTLRCLKPGSVSHSCCVCLPTPHSVFQPMGASWHRNDQPSLRDSAQKRDGSHPFVFHLLEQVPCSCLRSMGEEVLAPAQAWREPTAGSRLFSTGLYERAATRVPWQDPPHAQLWWEARKARMGGHGSLSTAGAPGVMVPKGIFLREKCRRSGPQQRAVGGPAEQPFFLLTPLPAVWAWSSHLPSLSVGRGPPSAWGSLTDPPFKRKRVTTWQKWDCPIF